MRALQQCVTRYVSLMCNSAYSVIISRKVTIASVSLPKLCMPSSKLKQTYRLTVCPANLDFHLPSYPGTISALLRISIDISITTGMRNVTP